MVYAYRFGFNGKENLDEIKGKYNTPDLGDRLHDPRLGKIIYKTDTREAEYPWQSPYAYYANSPIWKLDYNGEGDGWGTTLVEGTKLFFKGMADGSAQNATGSAPMQGDFLGILGLPIDIYNGISNGINAVSTLKSQTPEQKIATAETVGLIVFSLRSGIKSIKSSTSAPKIGVNVPEYGKLEIGVNLQERAKELHSQLHPFKQSKTTTAVTEAIDVDGNTKYVVGSSDKYLPKEIKNNLRSNEIGISKIEGHAEVTTIIGAKNMGLTPLKTGASRPICASCEKFLNTNFVKPSSPLKSTPKPVPYK